MMKFKAQSGIKPQILPNFNHSEIFLSIIKHFFEVYFINYKNQNSETKIKKKLLFKPLKTKLQLTNSIRTDL